MENKRNSLLLVAPLLVGSWLMIGYAEQGEAGLKLGVGPTVASVLLIYLMERYPVERDA